MDLRLDYAVSAGEMAEAQRVVRRFRYGGGKGLFLFALLFLFAVGMGVWAVVGSFVIVPDPPRTLGDELVVSAVELVAAVVVATTLCVSFVRGVTVRSRSEIAEGEVVFVRMTVDHLEVKGSGGRRSWLWSHFATVLESRECLLVMGVDSFVPVPKRVLVGVEVGDLRAMLEAAIVKRTASEGFDVIVGEKGDVSQKAGTQGEWFREERGTW